MLGLFLNGEEIPARGMRGERIVDDSFLLLVNGHHDDVTFTLPVRRFGAEWEVEIDTSDPDAEGRHAALDEVPVIARGIVVLRRVAE